MKLRTAIREDTMCGFLPLLIGSRSAKDHDATLAHCFDTALREASHGSRLIDGAEMLKKVWDRTAELARGFGLIED